MTAYRFRPITDIPTLTQAVRYVAEQTTALCEQATGSQLPISSLTIFAHDETEYARLLTILHTLGKVSDANNGKRATLREPMTAAGNGITHLRIRKPDVQRPQVGCNDFEVSNYAAFKQQYLANNPRLRLIKRPDYEMIEFFDPQFDVLAYVVEE